MNSAERFETIVSEHYEPLFRFAMSLTRLESDARDLTQQTFYVWATKGHQLRDISKVKTWLFTTLHRAFLQTRRRQVRFPHQDVAEVGAELVALSPDPHEQADCSQVLRALAGVDQIYQAAVALFYLEDCSYKDIAEILEVPIGTVKSRIARGVQQLRDILLEAPVPRASASMESPMNERSPALRQRPGTWFLPAVRLTKQPKSTRTTARGDFVAGCPSPDCLSVLTIDGTLVPRSVGEPFGTS